jgi:hypothetical protein
VPYATPTDVRAVLARDPEEPVGTAASLPDPELAVRIEAAAAQVDAALAGAGYTVPITGTVPVLVREITVAIAAWLADLTYRQNKEHEGPAAPVLQRYQWATGLLAQIAGRVVVVPGLPAPDTAAAAEGAVVVSTHQPYEGDLFTTDDAPWGPGRGAVREDYWW